MEQAIKQSLKPSWKKIAITIILALPPLLSTACISSNLHYDVCFSIDFLLFPYYLIILPVNFLQYLLALLGISYGYFPRPHIVYIATYMTSLVFYWYLLFSFIAWINDIIKNKPSIKKIIRIIGGLLIILLVIRNGLFFLPRIGYLVMEPTTLSGQPSLIPFFLLGSVILFTSPLIFISGILLLLQRIKWAWRLFLIALVLGLLFLILNSLNFLI